MYSPSRYSEDVTSVMWNQDFSKPDSTHVCYHVACVDLRKNSILSPTTRGDQSIDSPAYLHVWFCNKSVFVWLFSPIFRRFPIAISRESWTNQIVLEWRLVIPFFWCVFFYYLFGDCLWLCSLNIDYFLNIFESIIIGMTPLISKYSKIELCKLILFLSRRKYLNYPGKFTFRSTTILPMRSRLDCHCCVVAILTKLNSGF